MARDLTALIVGAGQCGIMVVKELKYSLNSKLYPVAFIDDDPTKHRNHILGLPILGDRGHIPKAVEELQISDIIIAMPSTSKQVSRPR